MNARLKRLSAIPLRPIVLGVLVLGFSTLLFERARAGDGHYFTPVKDGVVKEECGSCHLAFPPSMLPTRSWQRMMSELDSHFGNDASVDAATRRRIEDYLVTNAADTGGRRFSGRMLRGVSPEEAPQRITDLPRWERIHDEVSTRTWNSKKVGSKSNCSACHADAERGFFEDD